MIQSNQEVTTQHNKPFSKFVRFVRALLASNAAEVTKWFAAMVFVIFLMCSMVRMIAMVIMDGRAIMVDYTRFATNQLTVQSTKLNMPMSEFLLEQDTFVVNVNTKPYYLYEEPLYSITLIKHMRDDAPVFPIYLLHVPLAHQGNYLAILYPENGTHVTLRHAILSRYSVSDGGRPEAPDTGVPNMSIDNPDFWAFSPANPSEVLECFFPQVSTGLTRCVSEVLETPIQHIDLIPLSYSNKVIATFSVLVTDNDNKCDLGDSGLYVIDVTRQILQDQGFYVVRRQITFFGLTENQVRDIVTQCIEAQGFDLVGKIDIKTQQD